MSDSGGLKPQAFCFTGFASPSTLQAGTLQRPWRCFPMGQLQQQCWSSSAPDGFLHKLPGRRKPGWQCRMFLWQVDGLPTSSGLPVWWAARITTVCNGDVVWGLAAGYREQGEVLGYLCSCLTPANFKSLVVYFQIHLDNFLLPLCRVLQLSL